MNDQVSALIRQMKADMDLLKARMNELRIQGDQPVSMPGQYPGKPIPTTEGVEIDIGANTNRVMGNIVFSADGPFMARAVHFAWRPTEGVYAGMWRPISSANSGDLANDDDVIDFVWEYQITGSHRNRQNIAVPSALPHRAEEGYGFWPLHVENTVDATATVSFWITPTVAPAHEGVMYIGLSGAYILK